MMEKTTQNWFFDEQDKKNAGPEQSDFYCEMDTFKAGDYKPTDKKLPF